LVILVFFVGFPLRGALRRHPVAGPRGRL